MFFLCFKFISNITIPKNIGKIKINWNKKLTTTSTLYQTAFASKGLRFTHENGNLRLGLCNGTKLRRTDLESESLLFVEFICHCLTQLEELKTIWLWRRHFRATFSDRPVAACCCQLHCLRYIHERERTEGRVHTSPDNFKNSFFHESAVQLYESSECGQQNPLFEAVFQSVFLVDPTHFRILACRLLKRDIIQFSKACGFISPGFVRTRPAFYVSSRTPIQGTRYVEAPPVLTV